MALHDEGDLSCLLAPFLRPFCVGQPAGRPIPGKYWSSSTLQCQQAFSAKFNTRFKESHVQAADLLLAQTIFLWYVYQIDSQVSGANRQIAPGCNGCTFDQFLNYIQQDKFKFPKTTPVGTNLAPDVMSTAQWLVDNGYQAKCVPQRLFPSLSVQGTGIADILGAAADRMNQVKGTAATALVTNARLALEGVHEARLSEIWENHQSVLSSWLKGKGLSDVTWIPKSGYSSCKWQAINEDILDETAKQNLKDFEAYIDTVPRNRKIITPEWSYQSHRNAIRGVERVKVKAGC